MLTAVNPWMLFPWLDLKWQNLLRFPYRSQIVSCHGASCPRQYWLCPKTDHAWTEQQIIKKVTGWCPVHMHCQQCVFVCMLDMSKHYTTVAACSAQKKLLTMWSDWWRWHHAETDPLECPDGIFMSTGLRCQSVQKKSFWCALAAETSVGLLSNTREHGNCFH